MKTELLKYLNGAIEKARGEAAMWALRQDKVKTVAAVAVADELVRVRDMVDGIPQALP